VEDGQKIIIVFTIVSFPNVFHSAGGHRADRASVEPPCCLPGSTIHHLLFISFNSFKHETFDHDVPILESKLKSKPAPQSKKSSDPTEDIRSLRVDHFDDSDAVEPRIAQPNDFTRRITIHEGLVQSQTLIPKVCSSHNRF
jgi:hypothetical protein